MLMRRYFMPTRIFIALLCLLLPSVATANVIRDTEIEQVLLRIAQPMARQSGIGAERIHIRIVINPSYNAFVIGDNTIYIHSGLILGAENLLEVAGVMAHEIGHIASGHVQRREEVINEAGRATILGALVAVALTATGAGAAAVGVLVGSADQAQRTVLARSRQDEGVADEWAIRLMQGQSFSLYPMAETMRRLGSQRLLPQSRQSEYYQTHPSAHERSAVFQDHINQHEPMPLPTPAWMPPAFERIKNKLQAWTHPPKTTIANLLGQDDTQAQFMRAIALMRLADTPSARDIMAVLVAESPDNPFFREFYGDILLALGEGVEAARQYEQTLDLLDTEVNRGQILLSLGRAYVASGDPALLPQAITALEEASQLEPKWAFAKRQLGISYGKAGRKADADLTLAEEALIMGNTDLAERLAKRVETHADATAIHKQLAADILIQTGS